MKTRLVKNVDVYQGMVFTNYYLVHLEDDKIVDMTFFANEQERIKIVRQYKLKEINENKVSEEL